MLSKAHKNRLAAVVLVFVALSCLVWGRLLWLQVVGAGQYLRLAHQQHQLIVEIPATRGTLYDRNLQPLATDIRLASVYADPRWVKNKPKTARMLAPILGVSEATLLEQLKQQKGFVWLARKTSNRAADQIKKLRIPGIEMVKEPKRVYPGGSLGAHLIGFAGLDHRGLEGMELGLDHWLAGKSGWRWLQRDAKQRRLEGEPREMVAPRNGLDVALTVDQVIQYAAEQALLDVYKKYNAKGACMVVMNPRTGEILAMANQPSFDPNKPGALPADARRNRAVTDTFEPGSIFKIVTASAALQEKVTTPNERFFCEQGEYRIAGKILHDAHPHGWLTFREVIEQSSNIGVAKVAARLGPEPLYKYIRAYGFGQKTGIELPGEVVGVTKQPKNWSRPSLFAIPMGQEITVTALQLAAMISAVANDGILMKPWIIKEVRDESAQVIYAGHAQKVRQVISPDVVKDLKVMLEGVVERGTGRFAKIPGVRVAGKTGTAQKVEGGVYSHSRFTASFVGFAPAEDPQLAAVVVVDEPHPYYYGGVVAAPAFQGMAAQILPYAQQRTQPSPRLMTAGLSNVEAWD
ncbi:MAG: penicillin-binding protein 2 [Candidatus Omnitrophica bacterium]|nr:penicillin-binding protein 2 [Candidatus Omnitrophota bacterium]